MGSLVIFSNQLKAQITITDADMPSSGKNIYTAFDTVTSSISRLGTPASGANVVWNYNFLPTTYTDTDALVNISFTPYASLFPTATVADKIRLAPSAYVTNDLYGTTGYTFYDVTNSSLSIVGETTLSEANGTNYYVTTPFTPAFLQLNLPAHYGDVCGGTSFNNLGSTPLYGIPGADSGKEILTVTYNDTINAYGLLTTPLSGGTTYSVLCQKHYELDQDSVFVHSTTNGWEFLYAYQYKFYQYNWYANEIGYTLATMTMDSTNTKVTAMQWYVGQVTSINEIRQENNTLVYPNPCTNQITFHYNQNNAQNVSVYDITGRELGHTEIKNGSSVFNTSGYSAGVYLYRITDISGSVIDIGKFAVVK